MYTWDPPPCCATPSHVAIQSTLSFLFYPLFYYNGNITLKYSDRQTVMYTWDPSSRCPSLSHVAINSVVGVKLPEDGNNSCS